MWKTYFSGSTSELLALFPLVMGELVLRPPITKEQVDNVRTFLELQPTFQKLRHADETPATSPTTRNLDDWRKSERPNHNVTDCAFNQFVNNTGFGLMGSWHREREWFITDYPNPIQPVVINRTTKLTTNRFPWKHILQETRNHNVFVGTKAEHEKFCQEYEIITYYETPRLIHLARVIAGSKLLICNQSVPRALAEGMKHPVYVEQAQPKNTHWSRKFAFYDSDDFNKAMKFSR